MELFFTKRGRGEPLVLLHGLGSSHLDWEEQLPLLEQHFTVYALDFRGHGRSPRPDGPYSIPMFAEDVKELMGHEKIESAIFLGISMGGMVAMQLAVDEPSKVKKLVLVNTTPEVLIQSKKQKYLLYSRLAMIHLLGIRGLGEIGSRKLLPGKRLQSARKRLCRRFKKNDKESYLAALNAIIGWSVKHDLYKIVAPTLVISGDLDYTTPSEKKEWVAMIPQSEMVIIENSRHVSNYDQPEAFNKALAQFLF
ncbi:MAG: alpha/beta fold hydrolase [Pseudobdellovibrionaceae bacterium]|nr:alpha/beta fold hydrolase [Bdellovibrionales bacterium]USN46924.1 MAG: alpha/beta fold hydrolase [Pseudobdellovibrionaceae bacterium]